MDAKVQQTEPEPEPDTDIKTERASMSDFIDSSFRVLSAMLRALDDMRQDAVLLQRQLRVAQKNLELDTL